MKWLGIDIDSTNRDFVNHSYDYRPKWTPLSPVTTTNWISSHFRLFFKIKTEEIPFFLLAMKTSHLSTRAWWRVLYLAPKYLTGFQISWSILRGGNAAPEDEVYPWNRWYTRRSFAPGACTWSMIEEQNPSCVSAFISVRGRIRKEMGKDGKGEAGIENIGKGNLSPLIVPKPFFFKGK